MLRASGATYLDRANPSAVIRGLRFFGSSYSRQSNPHSKNSAFQHAEMFRVEPPSCDVLVTHGPPAGILDDGFGCEHLRASVERLAPPLHLFGHCHQCHGVDAASGPTTFVNAALCTWGWCATKSPVVVDVPLRETSSSISKSRCARLGLGGP
jgi:hypothetical protein